jgi:hypothetical protein
MPLTTVTTDVHQALNVKLNLGTKLALHSELVGDELTNSIQLFVVPFTHFGVHINPGVGQDFAGGGASYPKDVGEPDFTSFVTGQVYASYPCHNYPCLCLNFGFFLLMT